MTKIYAIYDTKAAAFLTPYFAPTHGVAVRSLQDAVNDPAHQFSRHAEDYSLHCLGEFDPELGTIEVPPKPEFVTLALSLTTVHTNTKEN